ncbi:MAG: hypothetical protein AAF433_13015 [Bacteroidota bacterium]
MPLLLLIALFICSSISAQSWEQIEDLGFGGRYEDIYFQDTDLGWVIASNGSVYQTVDGGENWEEILDTGDYLRAIDFLDDSTGFVGSLNSNIRRTLDGGESWEIIDGIGPNETTQICGLDHIGDHVFGVGWFAEPAHFIKSTDRGDSWSFTDMSEFANGLVECHFRSEELGFVAGIGATGAIILRTQDGGESWEEVFNSGDGMEFIWKIDFVNDTLAYGSVESFAGSCSIVKTVDGGASWTEYLVDSTYRDLQGIGFLDEFTGWVAPRNQPLYVTNDGGLNWSPTDLMSNVNRIFRVAPGLLYAGGSFVYRFNDLTSVEAIGPTPAEVHTIRSISPNPAAAHAEVALELTNATYVRLDLLDAHGRRVQEVFSEELPSGLHRISLGDLSRLPAGQYLVAMRTHEGHWSKAFIKQ